MGHQQQSLFKKYTFRFHIRIQQFSIQGNHIHLLIKSTRRFDFHYFSRVVAGQIAQRMQNQGRLNEMTDTPMELPKMGRKLWEYRVLFRVGRGYRAYRTLAYYIRLNELEALGRVKYQSQRLKGLLMWDWQLLWS